jgi:hypothetical protein
MRSTKRVLYALALLVVLLTATSGRPIQSQEYLCDPPYGSCFSYCVSGSHVCISSSWNGYFCAVIQGGSCYGTIYCDLCM